MRQLPANKNRRGTDEQIHVLRSHITFAQLASAMGLSVEYARRLRNGRIQYKTRSP